MDLNKYVYADNNGTTMMSERVIEKINKWMNKGNASAIYADAVGITKLIQDFKERIAYECNFSLGEYNVYITSGASEANNFILRSIAKSYIRIQHRKPHFIVSAIEHKSLLECAKELESDDKIQLSIINPTQSGIITQKAVAAQIQANTCLVCVMHANNETGVINEIDQIGPFLENKNPSIPFYVDAVQTFGKFPIDPRGRRITAFCGSFHKFGGPPGIGVIVLAKNFHEGYKLCSEICGSQNNGMRGGTENIPYIGGAHEAIKETFIDRTKKNRDMLAQQMYVIKHLMKNIPTSKFAEWGPTEKSACTGILNYNNTGNPPRVEMIIIGIGETKDPSLRASQCLPNTVMLAFLNHRADSRKICNYKLQEKLYSKGVIVGLGSACNKGQKSYVLDAMGVPEDVINSTIRISFGDKNEDQDAVIISKQILFSLAELVNESPTTSIIKPNSY